MLLTTLLFMCVRNIENDFLQLSLQDDICSFIQIEIENEIYDIRSHEKYVFKRKFNSILLLFLLSRFTFRIIIIYGIKFPDFISDSKKIFCSLQFLSSLDFCFLFATVCSIHYFYLCG